MHWGCACNVLGCVEMHGGWVQWQTKAIFGVANDLGSFAQGPHAIWGPTIAAPLHALAPLLHAERYGGFINP